MDNKNPRDMALLSAAKPALQILEGLLRLTGIEMDANGETASLKMAILEAEEELRLKAQEDIDSLE